MARKLFGPAAYPCVRPTRRRSWRFIGATHEPATRAKGSCSTENQLDCWHREFIRLRQRLWQQMGIERAMALAVTRGPSHQTHTLYGTARFMDTIGGTHAPSAQMGEEILKARIGYKRGLPARNRHAIFAG